MAFQIQGIDLNPERGNSFLGLTREQAKQLATIFLIAGILLALPPVIPDPSDLLSLGLANLIKVRFNIPLIAAIAITNILGILLVLLGAWIYPYNTMSLLGGYLTKLKAYLRTIIRNPKLILLSVIIFIFIYKWYLTQGG